MKRTFIMTSSNWDGQITLSYQFIDDQSYLCGYTYEAEMVMKQVIYLLEHFPLTHSQLTALVQQSPTLTITEVKREVPTFEQFWKEYGHKVDKVNALKEWNKLSDADKILCLDSIPGYKNYLKRKVGQDMIYPVRYINYRRFETNYYLLK